jgi:hypothetical protein
LIAVTLARQLLKATFLSPSALIGYGLGFVVMWISIQSLENDFGTPEFYGALVAANPALLIALVVEERFWTKASSSPYEAIGAALWLLASEWICLSALTVCEQVTEVATREGDLQTSVTVCGGETVILFFVVPFLGVTIGFIAVIRSGITSLAERP